MNIEKIKEHIVDRIIDAIFNSELSLSVNLKDLNVINLEIPKNIEFGDFAFPCFSIAKRINMKPDQIAKILESNLKNDEIIESIKAIGGYLNFKINRKIIFNDLLTRIKNKGLLAFKKNENKVIMVEYSSPNLNKPQHLGHVRNNVLGYSVSKILEYFGNKVIKANLFNDRGVGVSKVIYAYLYLTDKKKPDKKPDHYVGDLYVLFSKKCKENNELEEKAKEIVKRFELGDEEIISAWKKIREWVLEGYKETYEKLGCKFDVYYFESDLYKLGKEIVYEGFKKGLFIKQDNAIIAPLEKYGLPNKVLIKSDGTSLYITQDLALAKRKFEDYNLDLSIYVVASEQELHFKQLFKICELLNIAPIEKMFHLSYGLILLPKGKMKSREGEVVDADNFIDEMIRLAYEEVNKRYKDLDENEKRNIAEKIALAAIKFYILKVDPKKDVLYNPEESLSFEGETGPYVQYTYARICSLIRNYEENYGKFELKDINVSLLNHEQELKIISLMFQFEQILNEARKNYKPNIIANYLIRLCKLYNNYYHSVPILKSNMEIRKARLALSFLVKEIISIGLYLLDIEALERM